MTSAITATGLRKSFGGKVVLDGIDLEVGEGTTFSLLGPNGARKTTVVQIMSTVVHAAGGEVRVADSGVHAAPTAGHRPRCPSPPRRPRQPAACSRARPGAPGFAARQRPHPDIVIPSGTSLPARG